MWVIFGLLAPICFACVHVLDSYCVDDVYEKPWMGMVVSSFASIAVLTLYPFILPFVHIETIEWQIIGAAFLAGIIIQVNQALYFEALDYSDASIVAAYWNMTPALVPLFSFVLFDELLGGTAYLGIAIIIISSIGFQLLDTKLHGMWNSFLLIFTAVILQIAAIFLMDYVFDNISFYFGFLIFSIGLIVGGIFPLLFMEIRVAFFENIIKLKKSFRLFVYIELINLLAYGFMQAALKYGIPSFVSALEATTPAFVLLAGLIFSKYTYLHINNKIFGFIKLKIFFICCMSIGVFMIY